MRVKLGHRIRVEIQGVGVLQEECVGGRICGNAS